MTSNNRITLALGLAAAISSPVLADEGRLQRPATLDLRVPMRLAANAIPPRLDRRQGVSPVLSDPGQGLGAAHARPYGLGRRRHDRPLYRDAHQRPGHGNQVAGAVADRRAAAAVTCSRSSAPTASFTSRIPGPSIIRSPRAVPCSACWPGTKTTGDPAARAAIDRMVRGLRAIAEDHGDHLTYAAVKLEQSPGSHLAGYQIFPLVRYYELTGSAEALSLAEGLTRWAIEHDPTIGPDGEITKALSWEGHVHSWFETMAGSLRTARVSPRLDHAKVLRPCPRRVRLGQTHQRQRLRLVRHVSDLRLLRDLRDRQRHPAAPGACAIRPPRVFQRHRAVRAQPGHRGPVPRPGRAGQEGHPGQPACCWGRSTANPCRTRTWARAALRTSAASRAAASTAALGPSSWPGRTS